MMRRRRVALVEVLTVVGIIGILLAITLPDRNQGASAARR